MAFIIPESKLPQPMRVAPSKGTEVYFLYPLGAPLFGVGSFIWEGHEVDLFYLNMGLVHHSKENAREWYEWWGTTIGKFKKEELGWYGKELLNDME